MTELIAYLWQSNFCLLIFFLGYLLWLRKEQCFNYRRIYLLSTCLLSLVLPLLQFPTASTQYLSTLDMPAIDLVGLNLVPEAGVKWNLATTIPLIIYLSVALTLGGLMIRNLRRSRKMLDQCKRSTDKYRGHSVLLTNGLFPSSSYFNYLLLDDTLEIDENQKQLILDHELVHIKQGHSYDIILLELLKMVFWFNPVVWWINREIRLVHEFIADQKVAHKTNSQSYIQFLAKQTLHQLNIPWVHHFNNTLTLKRINMLRSSQPPTRLWKYGLLATIYVFLHVLVSCVDEQPVSDNTEEDIFAMVDERPAPVNGMGEFYQELGTTLKYPAQARDLGIEGKVYLSFVVQKSGELTDIKVLKGIGAGCDQAAVAALSKVDAWKPGILEGKPVAVQMQIPIVFKLGNDDA